jgi:hypothetical protein
MTPELFSNIYALVLGFAMAGLLASLYQLFAEQPLSFRLLSAPRREALISVPLLTFGAPFVIMRNTVRGRRIENRRFEIAMVATVLACFWSLMSGTVIIEVLDPLFR